MLKNNISFVLGLLCGKTEPDCSVRFRVSMDIYGQDSLALKIKIRWKNIIFQLKKKNERKEESHLNQCWANFHLLRFWRLPQSKYDDEAWNLFSIFKFAGKC